MLKILLLIFFIDAIAKEAARKLKKHQAKLEAKKKVRDESSQDEEGDSMSEGDGGKEEEDENEDMDEDEEDDDEIIDTVSGTFVEKLLRHLLRGFNAKGIYVRTRCCQIIALSISSIGEIE